jgi:phosphatidyl-myo-inositol alpha-mannosyltransferase
MRIAQICPYSLSMPGGVQGQVLGLARALRELGHEARVLAPCDGPPPEPMVTPLGKSLPTASNGSIAPIAPDAACALRTIHALRNEEFDILHLHEPVVPGPTMTSLFVSDVPKLGTFHAAGSTKGMAYTWTPWLTRRLANKLKVRIAVSPDAAVTAERNLGGKYDVLYNGIEIPTYRDVEPWEKSGPTIFFVGRHEPRKGLAALVDAMQRLPKNVTLWVAGIGPQTNSLKAITRDDQRIVWLGRISDREKARRLRAADLFCAPSIEGESFGIVLLEAMAAQTPVVASDLAGYRNVVRRDVDALLPPPGDTEALANAIQRVLDDKSLAESLRSNGNERAESFSMTHLAEQYVELYERCRRRYPFAL